MVNEEPGSALLVMDVQSGTVDRLENKDAYLDKVKIAVEAAHMHHLPVVYVVVGFRPGFPEISPSNKSFSALKESGRTDLVDAKPAIAPISGDLVVIKKRISAFAGSDLAVILSGLGVKRLVLCGIATSGVVLSTVREAADKDYRLSVLSDLCYDSDAEVHKLLIEKLFPRQADVLTTDQWIKNL